MSKEIIIHVPTAVVSEKIVPLVDSAAVDAGLTVTMRGSLKSFPGSTHWHLKRGRERGTLEIAWWPQQRRLWIKIHAGRTAAWIDRVTPKLKRQIQLHLDRLASSA